MIRLDRRSLLSTGLLAATGAPAIARAAAARGFTHDVASGEPGAESVLLWTRHVGRSDTTRLTAEVSESADFTHIASGGSVTADAARDHTAKIVVSGLAPGRWYYYRFVAADGTKSPVGRTRTLPDGPTALFRLGVFSCSNLPFGRFNAYAHAAARDDIDLMVHLGDYMYEYPRGRYPATADMLAGRTIDPSGETIRLADYRARFAAYRRDPDLLALHRRFPMIAIWDDHESANDSWVDGAENHDPATEGDWAARKAAAMQAYREWMPVSDAPWAAYRIGDVATLFRLEERLTARSRQLDLGAALKGQADMAAALRAFRDGPWHDPARTILGADQEAWLAAAIRDAAKATRWQVLAQQVNVGITTMPQVARDWLAPDAPDGVKAEVLGGTAAGAMGLPFSMDAWTGYPAARSRLLRMGLEADANLVVLSGDSHNAWAFDLVEQGVPAGVDFGVQSVTSPGFETFLPRLDPKVMAAGLVAASAELQWADTSRRGYMTVALTPERVTTEWLFLDTILRPSTAIASRHSATLLPGARRIEG
jgi:alkaline phosphatase D